MGLGCSFMKQNLTNGKDVLFTSKGDVLTTRLNEIKHTKNTIYITINYFIF